MESKNIESENQIKKSFNSIIEESEDSTEIKIASHRTRSHGKLIYSKITKKLKKNSPLKLRLSLNAYNSISAPKLQNVLEKQKASMSDYNLICELGTGSYGKVILAKSKYEGKKFAIKVIKKALLDRFDKQHEIHIERYCLVHLSHPNIIKFNKSFQDKKHLFFVLEYCKNKDLGKLIQKVGTFSYKLAQYYAAEIISAISYMNKFGIYHRDLKPENIGVDEDMHLKLFDFATANIHGKYFDKSIMKFVDISQKDYEEAVKNTKNNSGSNSTNFNYEYVLINGHKIMNLTEKFVGTPEYISPEVLENKYNLIGPGVDIWAFGVILYLFFVGQTPFKGKNDDETLNNIKNVNYTFEIEKKHSKGIINIPKEAKDLIQKILVKDPTKRIGYGSKDYKEIKEHPFFKGINFDNLFEEPIPLSKIYSLLENYGYIDKIDESKDKDDDIYVNVLNKSENDILFDDNRSIGSVDNADLSTSCKRLSSNNLNLLRKTLNSSLNDLKEFKDNMIIDNSNNIKNETPKGKKNSIDKLLIEDILYKKSPWLHYNKRYVKLYSRGHLDCYDISTKILKGTIIINESTKAYALDDFRFQIVSQNKTYFFKHISKRVADNWVEKINCIVFDKIRNTKNRNY
jgi:serine/threonine protein kinase